jgi:hypothetical protein
MIIDSNTKPIFADSGLSKKNVCNYSCKKIMDIILTPDPEIEIAEVEINKKLGKAAEDDIFRDLNLNEILNSTIDEISFSKEWFIKHTESVIRMLPGGMKILGIYTFSGVNNEVKESASLINKMFKIMASTFELPFNGHDLFLLSHTAESGWADAYFLDQNYRINVDNPVSCQQDKGIHDTLREADLVITHEFIYKVPKVTVENSINFKNINLKMIDCLNETIGQSLYSIEGKIVKTTDDVSFKSLLDVKYQARDEIERLQVKLFTKTSQTILNPEVKSSNVLKFTGCVHSKIYLHLDWSIHQFTKEILKDLQTSIGARIELMSDEAKHSECNIDP